MKNLVFFLALLFSSSLVAQFSYNENGSGIQSPGGIASGNDAFAVGVATQASGDVSTALGLLTTASGLYSTAMGSATQASGFVSTAMGRYTIAQDYLSFAIGSFNKTDETPNPNEFSYQNTLFVIGNGGYDSSGNFLGTNESRSNAFEVLFDGTTTIAGNVTAPAFIGDGSQLTNMTLSYNATSGSGIQDGIANASGSHSFAMGDNATSSGFNSRALGIDTTASGDYSTAMGYGTTASGSFSTAMGQGTSAQDYGTIAIGIFNKTKETSNPNQYSLQNTAFVIGNGLYDNRSNAFEVLFDGTTTIAGDINVNSDARLKANIISLGSTLAKLLQIDGKTYTMKKDESEKQKIGLLAQDIEKVFPELVSESNGIKSVNYQGLVPVLINALKEQQAEIDRLKTQEERLERLERLVAAMD